MTKVDVKFDSGGNVSFEPVQSTSPLGALSDSAVRNSLVSELMGWSSFIGTYSDLVADYTITSFTCPLGIVVNYLASVVALGDILKYALSVGHKSVDLVTDYTVEKRYDLSFEVFKLSQRVEAFIYRLIRLNVFVTCLSGSLMKVIADVSCSVEAIWGVIRADEKITQVEDLRMRELQTDLSNWKFVDALVKIAFHLFGMLALLAVTVVSAEEVLILGSVSVIVSLVTRHKEHEKQSEESKRVVEKLTRIIQEAA